MIEIIDLVVVQVRDPCAVDDSRTTTCLHCHLIIHVFYLLDHLCFNTIDSLTRAFPNVALWILSSMITDLQLGKYTAKLKCTISHSSTY